MASFRNEVLYRVYFFLFGIVIPVAVLLIYQTINVAIIEGDKWRNKGENSYVKEREVEAERGNVLAADGSLLATSIPYFDLYFDPFVATDEDFENNKDSLAICLAEEVDQTYTVGAMLERLNMLRDTSTNKDRFVELVKGVSYAEKKKIERFPLFRLGQYRGGLIAKKRSERKRPFGILANRTIGYTRIEGRDSTLVGLEGTFNSELGGKHGQQLMIKVDSKKDLWLPLNDLSIIEPKSGNDVKTTIDVNMQDIVERALLKGVNYHDAEWGTAVLMEVKTGAIRAIANLGRTDDGWYEIYNYAIGSAVEPGSTFKLASIMALLEDDFVSLNDSIDIERGETTFSTDEVVMKDATPYSKQMDKASVRTIFEISSNVGIAKLINHFYGRKTKENNEEGAERFIKRLHQFNLDLPTGIRINGEANPYVKQAYSEKDDWSGITLPWMSTGYELRLTPLQLLTFYNAVANNGTMMKPFLVSEVQHFGDVKKVFKPTVVDRKIASEETLEKVQGLLKGVVENGTARKLATDKYSFAGKTGTAQTNYRRYKGGTKVGGYRASFAGYFPADNPKYSCIVVINKPRQNGYYGGVVAGPIFREIVDQCFDSQVALHESLNEYSPVYGVKKMPVKSIGRKEDIRKVMDYLSLPHTGEPNTELAVLEADSSRLTLERRTVKDGSVPNVVGMGLRDALFLLENQGLKVVIDGYGRVVRQSLKPGTTIRGQTIKLTLR